MALAKSQMLCAHLVASKLEIVIVLNPYSCCKLIHI